MFINKLREKNAFTGTNKNAGSSAKDYVESLHQNSTATLLYGKNNVRVQPVSAAINLYWIQITFIR